MKKLTLILSLLVAMVTTAMAQESITISVDQNLTQEWTSTGIDVENPSYTFWGTDVIKDYPKGITPSSGNEVHMATTTNVTVSELGRLNFTFTYSSGVHRLNILGVDLLNAESEVVASDYHNGQTGGSHVNNTYTFIAAAGTYTIRYFVEHNTSGNDLRQTNGTISGTLTNVEKAKTAIKTEFESFRNTGMFTDSDINKSVTAIEGATATNVDEFKLLETTHFIYFYSTLNNKCFTFNSKGRETTNGRYLGVKGLNLDGTMDVVATDANELKNIWKLEYVDGKYFRLKNIAYDVYSKTTSEKVLAGNTTLRTTSQSKDAGLFFIKAQENGTVSIGADGGNYSFIHESNWPGHEIVRWEALPNGAASQWTATGVAEPELCSITYNNVYEGNNIQTEKLNVKKNEEYTFVNNYTIKTGLRLKDTTPVPAAEVITENKVVTYEYENILPFEPATVTSENRLAQGSKLYKITLRGKSVQLKADGTEFEYNHNAAIENQLFAVAGSVFDDWQMFNYAAGLNKPIWSPDNNNGTKMVPTAGVKDKLEIVLYNDNTGNHWSFKKKGTNYYLHDYGSNFAVWNDGTAYDDAGSYVVFTEATDKEISIATLNLDLKTATPYLSEELLDETIKTNLQNVVNEANTAIADASSTAEKLNEIDARLYQLAKDAANDMVVTNPNGFKNNGIYTFVTSRGWLLYTSENPDVVASSKKYNDPEPSVENDYCQWAMHKSVNGNYYMYNIGAGKFVGNPTSGNNIPFVATPTNDIKILAGTKSGYPIMVATNTSSVINHFNNSNPPGVANWNDGQGWSADDGSCHAVTKVGFINEETLTSITEMVDVYEAYINKPDLQKSIQEMTSFKESSFLTDEEKATIETAISEAQAVYDNPKYSTVAAEITKLNELKKQLQYIWNTENLSNNVCYIVSTEDRGSWFAEETETDGTRLNSTGKKSTNNENDKQFAFIHSEATNSYYLYSVGKNMFVKKDGNFTKLTEAPEQTISFLNGTRKADYPWVIAFNTTDGQKQIAISNSYDYGVITFYNDLKDAGNTIRLEKVNAFVPETALAKIEAYETETKKEELLAKINEANEFSAKTYLPQDKRDGLSAAAITAQGVYDNPAATCVAVIEQITIIEDLLNSCVYVTSPDGFSNNAIYTIVAKYNNGNAYVMYDEDASQDYAISSSKNFGDDVTIETGETIPGCQWALYTSSTSGKHYLYNIGAGKFMGTSNTGNGYIPLNNVPTSTDLIMKKSAVEEYPIMFSVNNGAGVLNHNNGNSFPYGLLNWHSTAGWNDTASASNVHKVTVVGALEEETLATIEELVNKFETFGVKQQELKTLLDNIYAGYYDEWANNNQGAWRINPGVNNYSQQEGDEVFVAAYDDARRYVNLSLEETSIEAIQAQIDRMNGLVANLTINQPEDGKYYRIRCTDGNRYLSSNTNDAGRMLTTKDKDQSNIFYYTNGGLLSYNRGVYIHAESSSNHVKLRDVAQTSTAEFIDGKDNNKSGSYIIYVKNSEAGAGRYIHGKNDTTDSGKDKPINGVYQGYTWWLEEVTELPVNITAAGYASFYTPVAVTVPSGIEAHYLTKIIGEFASMTKIESGIIPANTGVILTGENGEPATEGTYNLAITINDVSINNNMFKGTIATEYITSEAYVLAYGSNGIGLYSAILNKKDESAFQNNSHKAYLPASALTPAQMSAGFRFSFGGTTDIEEVETESENVKAIYDLTGRKLESIAGPGIYIIDGKKVIVK